ncbi:hypothetical protein TKK_0011204 [Trichogramma kaykai]|uniref:WAP domain-containing protein n=1 Tax=Trichogramma kaykai TaxID=54128 RepID=A0ABD2WTL8_9HYME
MHFWLKTPHILVVVVTLLSAVAECKPWENTKPCKYWCKEGKQYYCCPSGKKKKSMWSWSLEEMMDDSWLWTTTPWISYLLPVIFQRSSWAPAKPMHHPPLEHAVAEEEEVVEEEVKKSCPEIRPSCPRSIYEWSKPKPCDGDDECDGHLEKCCYDVCLEHKSCKLAHFS